MHKQTAFTCENRKRRSNAVWRDYMQSKAKRFRVQDDTLKKDSGTTPPQNGRNTPFYILIFESIWEHPIISAALLCFFTVAIITGTGVSKSGMIMAAIGVFALGMCASFYIVQHDVKGNFNAVLTSLVFFSASFAALFGVGVYSSQSPAGAFLNIGLAAVAGIYIYLGIMNRLSTRNIILLIAASGFLLRLAFILFFTITQHQHDVASIGKGSGHIGYIEYLYANGHLPDYDVRKTNQFYHSPFHHILAALWVKFQVLMGISYQTAFENIQVLTLFYSTLCMILSYRIFRLLRLHGKGLIFAFAVIAFNPTFIIMAGSINNDILSITLFLGAVLNTLKWYQNRTFKNIIAVALCIGLGMFTKLSVWMVAPAVAFVFIFVFFKHLKDFKKHLLQFLTFGVICVPIGLFWPVRNLVKFGVPLTFVQKLSENSKQYIGDIWKRQRLFDFGLYQYENVGDQFTMYGGKYNEFNPLVALFKTSAFDEMIDTNHYYAIAGFNTILFWSVVAVGLIGFVSMIYTLIKKSDELNIVTKIFIGLIYFVMLGSYYIFCFEFPHVCTENIRYAVPLIVIGAYFVGLAVQHLLSENSGRIRQALGRIICTITIIYCTAAALVYDIVVHSLEN